MTIVFSSASAKLIAVTVDSAVTLDFKDYREYTEGRKSYFVHGVGCVATWGARDHNRIGEFLRRQTISSQSCSIDDLASLVYHYLKEEYKPHELDLDDVGYHVAGFDHDGRPRLHHIFWGFDRPRPKEQTGPKYAKYDHSPMAGKITLLYNGRNDLAEPVVKTLLDEIGAGKPVRFQLASPEWLAYFGDFIARFAAELSPEVGPPFLTCLISPRNDAQYIRNERLCPINRDEVLRRLGDLGY